MLYLAYGSNLNKRQMANRCPNAKALENHILTGYKLEFRRVAHPSGLCDETGIFRHPGLGVERMRRGAEVYRHG